MAKAKESGMIILGELEISRTSFWIVGTSPLIVHRFSEKAKGQIQDKQEQTGIKGREAKDKNAEFESCFYFDPEGRYAFPLMAFKNAAVSACTSTGKKLTKIAARQFFHMEGPSLVRIHYSADAPPHPPLGDQGDPVRVGPAKTADLRYRPYFDEWAVALTVRFNSRVISQKQILDLFNLAGFAVGVGDWRPEKSGNNGMFAVMSKPTWIKE